MGNLKTGESNSEDVIIPDEEGGAEESKRNDELCQANVQRADQVWGMCTPERHCVAECTASTCTTRKLLRHVTGNQLNLFAKKIELYSKNKKCLT